MWMRLNTQIGAKNLGEGHSPIAHRSHKPLSGVCVWIYRVLVAGMSRLYRTDRPTSPERFTVDDLSSWRPSPTSPAAAADDPAVAGRPPAAVLQRRGVSRRRAVLQRRGSAAPRLGTRRGDRGRGGGGRDPSTSAARDGSSCSSRRRHQRRRLKDTSASISH